MKRRISFGIAVLMILVACLFVSCNSEVSTTAQVNDGKLVYATFDKMSKAIRPSSSSMTISYELDNINDLYWVYTATKTDGAGTTGQTDGARVPGNAEWKGLGGAIGPFSKGTWTFTVEGYKYIGTDSVTTNPTVAQLRDTGEGHQFNLIYVGTADGVVLNTTNTSTNPETINITVYLQTQGGTGTLKIAANSKFFWAATGEGGSALTDLKLKVYNGETPISGDGIALTGHQASGENVYYSPSSDVNLSDLSSGDHVFKVQIVRTVNDADQVFFEGTVNAKIYAGITTALDTQAIEGLFTYAQFNGTIDDSAVVVVATDTEVVTVAGSVSFETNYTPASGINLSTDKTTVSISGDTSVISAATYNLGVETSNIIAAGSKFSVESGSTAVASVDLTLTKTEGETTTTISTFGDNGAATVTTYIAKNLTDVQVHYNGDGAAPTDIEYDSTTGKLSFVTTHFSEFYVTSADKVYDNQANSCYTLEAFNNLDVSTIADHEFLLLDAAVANSIDDSRDVFNAGFKWAVIHTPSDLPNTTDFAGGYGTKIEPFLIANVGQLGKISEYYDEYNYYKVSETQLNFDCSVLTPMNLNGSFDGNNVKLNGLRNRLFNYIGLLGENNTPSTWSSKDVVVKNFEASFDMEGEMDTAGGMCFEIVGANKTTIRNVRITGNIVGGSNSGVFFSYTTGNTYDTNQNLGQQTIALEGCSCTANVYCTSSIGIVCGYATYCNPGIVVTVDNPNSIWNGTAYTNGKAYLMGAYIGAWIPGNGSTANETYDVNVFTKNIPTKTANNDYEVTKSSSATRVKVYIAAQLSETDETTGEKTAVSGITLNIGTVGEYEFGNNSSIKVLDVINSFAFTQKAGEYSYTFENGALSVKTGDSINYTFGRIRLMVVQYNENNVAVSWGELDIVKKDFSNPDTNTWVIQ